MTKENEAYKTIGEVVKLLNLKSKSIAQFAPAAGQPGSTAIHKDDPSIIAWASGCELYPGWINIQDTSQGKIVDSGCLQTLDAAGEGGRPRPQARAARLRARDDRRRERQRRRAARQAERDRRERERRWRQLKARTTDPIAKRVEAGKAAVAKGERERAAKRGEPPKQQLPLRSRPTPK